jgi:hypothetical protein
MAALTAAIFFSTCAHHPPATIPTMKYVRPCFLWIIISLSSLLLGQSSPAPTPPMGWNSWDAYGTTVREEQVKSNADWMAEHLAKYGWKYIVVDIQWYEPNAGT